MNIVEHLRKKVIDDLFTLHSFNSNWDNAWKDAVAPIGLPRYSHRFYQPIGISRVLKITIPMPLLNIEIHVTKKQTSATAVFQDPSIQMPFTAAYHWGR